MGSVNTIRQLSLNRLYIHTKKVLNLMMIEIVIPKRSINMLSAVFALIFIIIFFIILKRGMVRRGEVQVLTFFVRRGEGEADNK